MTLFSWNRKRSAFRHDCRLHRRTLCSIAICCVAVMMLLLNDEFWALLTKPFSWDLALKIKLKPSSAWGPKRPGILWHAKLRGPTRSQACYCWHIESEQSHAGRFSFHNPGVSCGGRHMSTVKGKVLFESEIISVSLEDQLGTMLITTK